MKKIFEQKIIAPNKVVFTLDKSVVSVKGPKGELKRDFTNPSIEFMLKENTLMLRGKKVTQREKKMVNTYTAHIENMVHGVQEAYVYKLKICSSHFPMNVTISGNELIVKNFLGEKTPRKCSFRNNASVKLSGNDIIVESIDKEAAGQTAATIEQSTRISNRDKRVFQDGIFIIEKANKKVI